MIHDASLNLISFLCPLLASLSVDRINPDTRHNELEQKLVATVNSPKQGTQLDGLTVGHWASAGQTTQRLFVRSSKDLHVYIECPHNPVHRVPATTRQIVDEGATTYSDDPAQLCTSTNSIIIHILRC